MSSTDYNYDEQGQFFPYFVITVTALFTIPITYSALKPSKELENTAPRIQSNFQPDEADLVEKQRRKLKRKERREKSLIAAALGWALIAYMVYLISVTARTAVEIWNPYEILDISMSATEKQIKSRYRKLSLTQHPDKARPDAARNVTIDTINTAWVEITKAFKALTDDDVRNNWIQYGHPDGKQSFSIGIALPQFIVREGNGKYVLLLYGALLGVVLPYLVGTWWYGSQKVTKEKILVASAGRIFTEYREDMREHAVVRSLSTGEEYEETLSMHKDDDSLRTLERALMAECTHLTNEDREMWMSLKDDRRKLALGLLWAYMHRVKLSDALLDSEKYEVAPVAFALNEAFGTMAPFFQNTIPLIASYRVSQRLVQAIPPGASPLLQLPHFTDKIAVAAQEATMHKNASVQTFMSIPDAQRRKAVVGSGLLSSEQYTLAMDVASQLPALHIEKAFFKVTGERYITPGSLLQFVVKVRIIPPGASDIPPVEAADLEDIDPKEGDLDALHGRKPKTGADGKTVVDTQDKTMQPPLTHAPYFPQDHAPIWRIFLGENKSSKIAVPPFTFSTFDKPLYNEQGRPTFNVQTLKMQFAAPQQAGQYPFTANLICDSYVGMDSQVDVVMDVREMAQAEEMQEEDEISEPEEDSIAGQMNTLRGAEPGRKPKRVVKEEESDDESDTDGDESTDSDTDTDTDTDDE